MSRALGVVVVMIVLSLLASTLHVVDAALSRASDDPAATSANPPVPPDVAQARDASLVDDMPPGAVDAVSL